MSRRVRQIFAQLTCLLIGCRDEKMEKVALEYTKLERASGEAGLSPSSCAQADLWPAPARSPSLACHFHNHDAAFNVQQAQICMAITSQSLANWLPNQLHLLHPAWHMTDHMARHSSVIEICRESSQMVSQFVQSMSLTSATAVQISLN